MSESRAYIHVGHHKTGSSYLQRLFAENAALLREFGIIYPPALGAGHAISTPQGNAPPRDLRHRGFARRLASMESVLLSSENLFPELSRDLSLIHPVIERYRNISMLLLIRDPYDYARSYYIQRVKGGRFNGSIDDYIVANGYFVDYLERVASLVSLTANAGIALTVHNYSTTSLSLTEIASAFLGIDPERFAPPEATIINRGLTRSELYLQRAFNASMPSAERLSTYLIALPLVRGLPDIPTELPRATDAIYAAMRDRINAALPEVNALLPAAACYRPMNEVQPAVPPPDDQLTFSEAQIDILARSIGNALATRTDPFVVQLRRFAGRIKRRLLG